MICSTTRTGSHRKHPTTNNSHSHNPNRKAHAMLWLSPCQLWPLYRILPLLPLPEFHFIFPITMAFIWRCRTECISTTKKKRLIRFDLATGETIQTCVLYYYSVCLYGVCIAPGRRGPVRRHAATPHHLGSLFPANPLPVHRRSASPHLQIFLLVVIDGEMST